jgi:tetratricopeptide (TPR) repeat protein
MTLVGQPPLSPPLQKGLALLAQGEEDEGLKVVRKAAQKAKAKHGSGSHPLARAYGDMARYHFRMGEYARSAQEFHHASNGPMPSDKGERQDRLAFMFGFGAALGELGNLEDAEKVLRQCLAFARNLNGGQSASAAVALVPLADVLLRAGKTAEATKLANDAFDSLWKLGDFQFTKAVGTRAETFKATGRTDDPFADLSELPDDMVNAAIATTLERAGKGDAVRVRTLLADLLEFVDKKYGDGHTVTSDTLAAISHHEAALGSMADERVRRTAVRRSVWSYTVRRMPGGLLANLEVGFESTGAIHIAPHLTREPDSFETEQLETILNQAIDDMYARPTLQL